jgi:hypothetical protein
VTGAPAFGFAADAQNVHLVSPLTDGFGLRYSDWLSAIRPEWTNPPEKALFPEPALSGSLAATATAAWLNAGGPAATTAAVPLNNGLLAAAAVRTNGGWLAVGWVRQEQLGMQVFLERRSIPETTRTIAPTAIPTGMPTPVPTLTALPPQPTSTPDLNLTVTGRSLPVNPMYLGGGLAALMVLLALGVYGLSKGRRR